MMGIVHTAPRTEESDLEDRAFKAFNTIQS